MVAGYAENILASIRQRPDDAHCLFQTIVLEQIDATKINNVLNDARANAD
jgi:hypothetical protein